MRVRLIVEYDGTNYAGWQRQDNALAVQQVLEEALAKLTRAPVRVAGASRTDAGVHALGQVLHFDTHCPIPPEKYPFALNPLLPDDIRVLAGDRVPDAFHARFDAKGKRYRYLMYDRPHSSALYRNHCAHSIYPLDTGRMQREAEAMLGTHDFAAFAASGSLVKDTVRTVTLCQVRRKEPFVELTIEGTGFLYNMVRILAGTLMGVGSGKLSSGTIERALRSRNRLSLGVTAPPQGLTLLQVFYE